MVDGWQGVLDFTAFRYSMNLDVRKRWENDPKSTVHEAGDAFHDGEKLLKEPITGFMNHLMRNVPVSDTVTSRVISLIRDRLLIDDIKTRASCEEIVKLWGNIKSEAERELKSGKSIHSLPQVAPGVLKYFENTSIAGNWPHFTPKGNFVVTRSQETNCGANTGRLEKSETVLLYPSPKPSERIGKAEKLARAQIRGEYDNYDPNEIVRPLPEVNTYAMPLKSTSSYHTVPYNTAKAVASPLYPNFQPISPIDFHFTQQNQRWPGRVKQNKKDVEKGVRTTAIMKENTMRSSPHWALDTDGEFPQAIRLFSAHESSGTKFLKILPPPPAARYNERGAIEISSKDFHSMSSANDNDRLPVPKANRGLKIRESAPETSRSYLGSGTSATVPTTKRGHSTLKHNHTTRDSSKFSNMDEIPLPIFISAKALNDLKNPSLFSKFLRRTQKDPNLKGFPDLKGRHLVS
jgi:hypothetical protein